ncbi:hypothetical protein L2E82_36533 [Cichorium intybus]|uniref:Uncharacterized protein n=1 Tax=Cichorium intybus TaxID=13427 RepID=A0ACB9BRW1_CICIN|nr:hypothetical protein L2E82_36533 [Cichorium intybus]
MLLVKAETDFVGGIPKPFETHQAEEGGKKLGFSWRIGTVLPELKVDQVEIHKNSDQVAAVGVRKNGNVVVADEGDEEV